MPALPGGHRLVISTATPRGTSAVLSDQVISGLVQIPALPAIWAADLWVSDRAPADTTAPPGRPGPAELATPARGGHVLRFLEIQPDPDGYDVHSGDHATPTLDHVIVVSGEIYCVFDEGEVLLRAGDVLVQRGVRHAWSNRSGRPCRLLGVLVDAARPDQR